MVFTTNASNTLDIAQVFSEWVPNETNAEHENVSSLLRVTGNATVTHQVLLSFKRADDMKALSKMIQSRDSDHSFPKILLIFATIGLFGKVSEKVEDKTTIPFSAFPENLKTLIRGAAASGIQDICYDDQENSELVHCQLLDPSIEKPNQAISNYLDFLKLYDDHNKNSTTLSDSEKSKRGLRYNLLPDELRDLFLQEFFRISSEALPAGAVVTSIAPDEISSIATARTKFLWDGGMGEAFMKSVQKAEDSKVSGRPILRITQASFSGGVGSRNSSTTTNTNNNSNTSSNTQKTCPNWAKNPLAKHSCSGNCGLLHSFRDMKQYKSLVRVLNVSHSDAQKKQIFANHLRTKPKNLNNTRNGNQVRKNNNRDTNKSLGGGRRDNNNNNGNDNNNTNFHGHHSRGGNPASGNGYSAFNQAQTAYGPGHQSSMIDPNSWALSNYQNNFGHLGQSNNFANGPGSGTVRSQNGQNQGGQNRSGKNQQQR